MCMCLCIYFSGSGNCVYTRIKGAFGDYGFLYETMSNHKIAVEISICGFKQLQLPQY